ncbi:MAG TPA: putative sulfate exporter family transporter, partial [Cyclobacteriaceae bacterium]
MSTEVSGKKQVTALSEDWVVVLLGFLIIGISLFVFVVPAPAFSWKSVGDLTGKIGTSENLLAIVAQFGLVLVIGLLSALFSKKPVRSFLIVFPIVWLLSLIALVLAGNSVVKSLNLEAVIFSLSIGLIIGNLFALPDWFRSALSTELFVKIGLVLLGTSVIFSDILKAGSLGLIQALVVVISVWYFAFWI